MSDNRPTPEQITRPFAAYEANMTPYVVDLVRAKIIHTISDRILSAADVRPVRQSIEIEPGHLGKRSRTTRVIGRSRSMHAVTRPTAFETGHHLITVADESTNIQRGRRGQQGRGKPEIINQAVTLSLIRDADKLGLAPVRRDSYLISTGSPDVLTMSEMLTPSRANDDDPSGINPMHPDIIAAYPHWARMTRSRVLPEEDYRSNAQRLANMIGTLGLLEELIDGQLVSRVVARGDNLRESGMIDLVADPDVSRVNGQRLALTAVSDEHNTAGSTRLITIAPLALEQASTALPVAGPTTPYFSAPAGYGNPN